MNAIYREDFCVQIPFTIKIKHPRIQTSRSNMKPTKIPIIHLLLLLLAFQEMIIMRCEGVTCEAESRLFNGACFSSKNCETICEKEGFSNGRCKFWKCKCSKDCGIGGGPTPPDPGPPDTPDPGPPDTPDPGPPDTPATPATGGPPVPAIPATSGPPKEGPPHGGAPPPPNGPPPPSGGCERPPVGNGNRKMC